MSKLEDLVPDRKLCEQIPDGCFENTALAWDTDYECWYVTEREKVEAIIGIPAPTLAEIMATMHYPGVFMERDNKWSAMSAYHSESDVRPEDAALKLWLELNKSDLSDKSDTDRKGGE